MGYPVVLSIAEWPVLVVGGGRVGERRVEGLLAAGARMHLVAPDVTEGLATLITAGHVVHDARRFEEDDLQGIRLVVIATPDEATNLSIADMARRRGILVNDAVESERGDIVVPAIHRIGRVSIAVATEGASPSFARRIRDDVAAHIGPVYGLAAETLRSLRALIHAAVPLERRAALMAHFAALPIEDLAAMRVVDQENAIEEWLEEDVAQRHGRDERTTVHRRAASRRTPLALAQTRLVAAALARARVATSIVEITARADRFLDRSLTSMGSGVFVTELETALREGRADYAVHSCKDLPSRLPDDMRIAAIMPRADPCDVLCSYRYDGLAALPLGARVGTSSPRRRAQLANLRPDLLIEELRGSVNTRLQRLADGAFDAVLLAAAGLARLGLSVPYMERLDPDLCIPAVAQGALAIEVRSADVEWAGQVRHLLNDPSSELAVVAERAFLAEVRGGCHAPVAAYAAIETGARGGSLRLRAMIASLDGARICRGEASCTFDGSVTAEGLDPLLGDAIACGTALAQRLLDDGGRLLLAEQETPLPLQGRRLLLGRTQERPSRIAAALREIGAEVVEVSARQPASPSMYDLDSFDAILIPSSAAAQVLAAALAPTLLGDTPAVVIAMGAESAAAASAAGLIPHRVAADPSIGAFVQAVTHALLEHAI